MLIFTGILAVLVLVLTGCPQEKEDTMSKSERLDQFVSDINNDNTSIGRNLSDNANNSSTANLTFWQTEFGEANSLAYSGYSESGDDVTATFTNDDITTTSYTFRMEEEKKKYYVIRRVTRNSDDTVIFD
jgi:hypothetical protein